MLWLVSPYATAYTFLPMGNAPSPQSQLRADAAFHVPLEERGSFLSQLDELPVELVASQPQLLLVRADDPRVLAQLAACNPSVRLSPVDAGPFGSLEEAAALLHARTRQLATALLAVLTPPSCHRRLHGPRRVLRGDAGPDREEGVP